MAEGWKGRNNDASLHTVVLPSQEERPLTLQWRVREKARVKPDQIIGYSISSTHRRPIKSPCHGHLVKRLFPSGHTFHSDNSQEDQDAPVTICLISEEVCKHSALVEGLCVDCGSSVQDSSAQSAYTSTLGFVASGRDIHTTHEFATHLEVEKIQSLLTRRKLPLVLDLDNTLLHACSVPPPSDTEEFFRALEIDFKITTLYDPELYVTLDSLGVDELNALQSKSAAMVRRQTGPDLKVSYYAYPHYTSAYHASVVSKWESWVIEMNSDELPAYTKRTTPYAHYFCYYKLRPGVIDFLRKASQIFELYLFTAGTLMHATLSLCILDPARLWFGDRVFTREDLPLRETGGLGLKTIQRIFPGELTRHTLVTIVDDSDTVWAHGSNVVKVNAYHWWPDPTFHPILLLYFRRTLKSAGSHSYVPVGIIDVEAFTRFKAVSAALLNYVPSVIRLCRSPRVMLQLASSLQTSSPSSPDLVPILDKEASPAQRPISSLQTPSSPSVAEGENAAKFLGMEAFIPPCPASETKTCSQVDGLKPFPALLTSPSQIEPRPEALASYQDHFPVLPRTTDEPNEPEPGPPPSKLRKCNDLSAQSSSHPVPPPVPSKSVLASGRHDFQFGLPVNGETINETNARVLSAATEDWKPPKFLRDSDRQLAFIYEVLIAMHAEFFRQFDLLEAPFRDITKLPNVTHILDCLRGQILKNVTIKCTGIREATIPDFRLTDLGRAVTVMGGRIISQASKETATHLLVGKETDYYVTVKENGQFKHTPHLMWLEAALFTFQRLDESLFNPERCEQDCRVFWDVLNDYPIQPFRPDVFVANSPPCPTPNPPQVPCRVQSSSLNPENSSFRTSTDETGTVQAQCPSPSDEPLSEEALSALEEDLFADVLRV